MDSLAFFSPVAFYAAAAGALAYWANLKMGLNPPSVPFLVTVLLASLVWHILA